jgi:hypothetical protein
MATFLATAAAETFTNPNHSVRISVNSSNFGPSIFQDSHAVPTDIDDPNEPYNGHVEGTVSEDIPDAQNTMLSIMSFIGGSAKPGNYYFEVFAGNSVDYSLSPQGIFADLNPTTLS